jgi:hypothetical protein
MNNPILCPNGALRYQYDTYGTIDVKPFIIDGIVQFFIIDEVNSDLEALYPTEYCEVWCQAYQDMTDLEALFNGRSAKEYLTRNIVTNG